MASTSETGHAINVANFQTIIADVASYGANYNPSKDSLKPKELNHLLEAAKKAINGVNEAEPAYKLAVNDRDAAFKAISPLVTKIFNALKASDTTEQVKETAQSLVRKIQGRRATPKKTEEEKKLAAEAGKEIVEISSSQMGYDNRIENFDKFIKLLSSIAQYTPNEEELKITTLTELIINLKAKNTAVTNTEVPLTNARIARNEVLYKSTNNLVDTALNIKTYIKSVYGTTSPQYKKISKIKFTKAR